MMFDKMIYWHISNIVLQVPNAGGGFDRHSIGKQIEVGRESVPGFQQNITSELKSEQNELQ